MCIFNCHRFDRNVAPDDTKQHMVFHFQQSARSRTWPAGMPHSQELILLCYKSMPSHQEAVRHFVRLAEDRLRETRKSAGCFAT